MFIELPLVFYRGFDAVSGGQTDTWHEPPLPCAFNLDYIERVEPLIQLGDQTDFSLVYLKGEKGASTVKMGYPELVRALRGAGVKVVVA